MVDNQAKQNNEGNPPYGVVPPVVLDTPVITKQPQPEQQQEGILKGGGGDMHLLCLGCCIFTAGLSFPLWLVYCCLKSSSSN